MFSITIPIGNVRPATHGVVVIWSYNKYYEFVICKMSSSVWKWVVVCKITTHM